MIQTGTGKFQDKAFFFDKPSIEKAYVKIDFTKPFINPPVVNINLTSWINIEDFQEDHNVISRFNVTATKATTKGFVAELEIHTKKKYPARELIMVLSFIQFSWLAYDEVTIGA